MVEKVIPLAMVTGSAHRLGRAFAVCLARQGYAILLHYHRSARQAAETAEEIRSLGVPVFLAEADLTSLEQIPLLFDLLDAQPHPLQVLVNSAGMMPRGDARTLSAGEWDATLALNLRAPFLLAQGSARRMPEGGLIVNVTDIGAMKTWSAFPAYTVSKAGLEALTRVLARVYAPEIRVNAIAPGLVLPSEQVSPQEWEKLVGRLPLKQPVNPDDVAAALVFLLNNRSITGQTVTVDGGYSLI